MKKVSLIAMLALMVASSVYAENVVLKDSTDTAKYKQENSQYNSIKKRVNGWGETLTEMREKQSGVSIISHSGIVANDIEYINDLFAEENSVVGSPLYGVNAKIPVGSTNYSTMFYSGGSLMAGLGNGYKIGFSGFGSFRSYDFSAGANYVETAVATGYGGLAIERGFVSDKHNFTTGVLLGAGGTAVGINVYENVGSTSAFMQSDDDSDSDWDEDWDDYDHDYHDHDHDVDRYFENKAHGAYGVAELNLAYSYTLISWLHIGADAKATVKKSIEIDNNLGKYLTVNPALGLRVVFGTLG